MAEVYRRPDDPDLEAQRQIRRELPAWPPPSVRDRLLFAQTEGPGETGEAILRQNEAYSRNRPDKQHDPLREAGQAYMMILDAIAAIQDGEEAPAEPDPIRVLLYRMAEEIAGAALAWERGNAAGALDYAKWAREQAHQLIRRLGGEPSRVLYDEHQRIRLKFGGQMAPTTIPYPDPEAGQGLDWETLRIESEIPDLVIHEYWGSESTAWTPEELERIREQNPELADELSALHAAIERARLGQPEEEAEE